MHTNETTNSIIIENPSKLPFPTDILSEIKDVKWENLVWNAVGLPAFNCSFSLNEDQLYFEKDEIGNTKLKISDFTGQALIHGVITPNNLTEIYFIIFELSFCGGKLTNSELKELKKQPREEYELGFQKFQAEIVKNVRMRKSLWFRFLYKPYFYIISWITTIIVSIIGFLVQGFLWFVQKILLPIKI